MRIDAHQHFWKYNPQRDSWITNDMRVLQRDFLPHHLEPLLQQEGFDGCIAVQADQSEEETEFLLQLADESPFIQGVVGWVDLQSSGIEDRLAYFSQFQKLKGFRHIVQAERDEQFMQQPAFMHGISLLHTFNFTYDILIYPHQLPSAEKLVASFPAQKFIVDHLAKPLIKAGEIEKWKRDLRRLAQHPNVYCKVSGLVTEAHWQQWKESYFTPYLDVVTEAFGMHRLVYGSDWPVCLLAATYRQQLKIIQNYFQNLSEMEQAQVFGGNAQQFYQL